MKPFRLILFFFCLAATPASAQKVPVYGKYTWYEGLDTARSEGKSLLVYISQKACSYCKELDKNLAADAAMLAFLQEKFVLVRHSISTPYGKAFSIDYRLQTTPALIVQNPLWPENPLILYSVTDVPTLRKELEKYLAGNKQ